MEENIKVLEEFIEDYKELVTQKKEVMIDYKYLKEKEQAIENLIAGYNELEQENRIYKSQLNSAFDNGFIPKSALQELLDIDEIGVVHCRLKKMLGVD